MPMMMALLGQYQIGDADLERIREIGSLMNDRMEELADHHYSVIHQQPELARFFPDERTLKRARAAFVDWAHDLFRGDYDDVYYVKVNRIGATHVRIGLPAHTVNVQMSHIRGYLADVIHREYRADPRRAAAATAAIGKVLDLNLDMMTRSYREEELRVNFLSYRLDSMLIRTARWFVTGFNLALVFGLMVIGVLALGLAGNEVIHFVDHRNLERAAIGSLSTILILWVVIELLDTQIKHMKGHAFAIKVFVSVALVAELRRILIASIEHTDSLETGMLAATVMVLGLVYWLVSRIER
jgi:uncharacterized membrane protein (DUF373 family)